MDVIEAIHSWRSIRDYSQDAVDRDEVANLLWHAVQVSTPPQNETPWELCVLEGPDRIAVLGERAIEFAWKHRPPGDPGWNWVDQPGFEVFRGAPVVIMICAQSGNRQALFDCHRAGQNLVLAAHARGFGTCWLGAPLPWLESEGVAEELGISRDHVPTAVIALGRPAVRLPPKSRPHPDIVWCFGE